MTLLYFGVVPGALLVRRPLLGFHYSFRESLEDLLLLTYLRGFVVVTAYTFGAGAKHHRWADTVHPPPPPPGTHSPTSAHVTLHYIDWSDNANGLGKSNAEVVLYTFS